MSPVDVRWAPSLDFLRVLDWMLELIPLRPGDRFRRELESQGLVGPGLEDLREDYRSGEELLAGLLMGMHDVLQAARSGVAVAGTARVDLDLARAASVYRSELSATVLQQVTGRTADVSRRPDPPGVLTVVGSGGPPAQRRSPLQPHLSRGRTPSTSASYRPDKASAESTSVQPTVA